MFKKIAISFAKARTASALSRLSDRQLYDIGIERGQIWERVEAIYA